MSAGTKDPDGATVLPPLHTITRAYLERLADATGLRCLPGCTIQAHALCSACHPTETETAAAKTDAATLTLTREELELVRRAFISRADVHPCDWPKARDTARSVEAKLYDALRKAGLA